MMAVVLRVVGAIAGAVVLAAAIYLLRETTMSTHYETGPDSRLVVVLRAESNRAEEGVRLEQMASAQIDLCTLEVSRAGDVQIVREPGNRFVVTLQPSLDSTDRKQFQGCLEDWYVDHLRLHVESLSDHPSVGAASDRGDGG